LLDNEDRPLLKSEILDDCGIPFLGEPIAAPNHQIDIREFRSMIRALDRRRSMAASV
jgi:hypothetical protein